ncbi:hypothetical protein [Halorubrum sp. CSM-61]|uniref:hypothetical protein n=1 Tax=Halorubrum sp. CSM-61 TaxID=2485838 RepID=UPI0013DE02C5|nr:hypothetical protein [Halorubrum sp. CSM-61]
MADRLTSQSAMRLARAPPSVVCRGRERGDDDALGAGALGGTNGFSPVHVD